MSEQSFIAAIAAAVVAQLDAAGYCAQQAPAPAAQQYAPPAAQATIPTSPPLPAAPVAVPAMPAPPTWSPPAPAAPQGAPFNSPQGLIEYATAAFHALEGQAAGKGASIENVVKQFGLAALTDLPAAGYPAFYAAVEALKA